MGEPFPEQVTPGGVLVYPQMKSPNYVAGTTGWAVFSNGNVEFNSGTFRGTVAAGSFTGTDFVINSSGEFFYNGTPALGNLIASITSASGTDSFGNTYPQGISAGGSGSNVVLANGNGYVQVTNGSTVTIIGNGAGFSFIGDGGAAGGTNLIFSGNVIYPQIPVQSAGSLPAAESWHSMSLQNSWSASGRHARYRLLPDGNVQIDLEISGGTITNGTVVWTAPSGYVPSAAPGTQHLGMDVLSGATATQLDTPRFDITTGGNLIVENIPTGTTIIGVSAIYSLT